MATKRIVRRLGGLLALLALLCLLPARASAWGHSGHRITAMIAERYLTPKAKQSVSALLRGESLAAASTFADEWRDNHPETAPWHFVDVPLKETSYVPARDCPKKDCALAKIDEFRAVLTDPAAPEAKRLEALKFIVHLVGDLHQPLHCSDNDDEAGNLVGVRLPDGDTTSLHRVWDAVIIYYYTSVASGMSGGDEEVAAELASIITPEDIKEIQAGDTLAWMTETHALAPMAYENLEPYKPPRTPLKRARNPPKQTGRAPSAFKVTYLLTSKYYFSVFPVVDAQLIRGGVRLAQYLNDIYK